MVKPIAIYVRVSSRRQDTASQEPDLKRWAADRGGQIRWYRDKVTGTTMDRPGFNRLLRDLEAGGIDTLVVWRLDRLGRTAKGLSALFEDLIGRKVNLISLRDGLDLATPAGRLMANVLASMAAYETEVRAERVLAGQAAARERGLRWGGSVKGRRLKVTADQEAAIRRMKAEGTRIAVIARATGLSRPTIYRVLGGPAADPGESKRKPSRRKGGKAAARPDTPKEAVNDESDVMAEAEGVG